MLRALVLTMASLLLPATAAGQFNNTPVTDTGFAWILGGSIVRGDDAPPIEAGDQIGAFFDGALIGFVTITQGQASASAYSSLITFGDNPGTTQVVEGPAVNQTITFQYYDASTNTTLTDLRALNGSGEPINLAWQGGEVLNLPGLPLPPELLTPSNLDQTLRLGGGSDDGGGDNGGGGTTGNPDVNNDGVVDREDAAMVLRVVVGGARTLDEATIARADVNGDGVVSTEDAIAILRIR